MPHIRFDAELDEVHWDDAGQRWMLHMRDASTSSAEILITPGAAEHALYRGPSRHGNIVSASFHSARWSHAADLVGKRVASIGSGPSAAQFIPELASVAGHLTVFQRSPNHVLPRQDRAYTQEERRAYLEDPAKLVQSRESFYREHEGWHGAMRLGTETADAFGAVARAQLEAQVTD